MAYAPTPMPLPNFRRPVVNQPANGLAGFLGMSANPFLDFLHNNSNTLLGLGAGLAGGGPDLGQAIGQGLQYAGQGRQLDDSQAKMIRQQQATAKLLAGMASRYADNPDFADLQAAVEGGTLDPSEAFNTALQWDAQARKDSVQQAKDKANAAFLKDPALKSAVESGQMSFADAYKYQTRGINPADYGQTPVFLTDGKGGQHIGQMSSTGGLFVDGKTLPGIPEGWSVIARPDNLSSVDYGGGLAVFNPNTGQYELGPLKQGAPSANMDVTQGPNGSRTMTPAAGSPEAIKQRGDRTAAQTSLGLLEQKQGFVGSTIDHALQIAQTVPSTGPFSLLNAIPGTPQYDLAQTLQTIKANIGFDQLQQMRENSPTGGALGQVSDIENRLLQATLGSLEQAQSLPQFVQNLQQLKQILAQSTDERRRAFAQDFPDMPMPPQGGGGGPSLPDPLGLRGAQ